MKEYPSLYISKIHSVRGIRVMLDQDLAELYGVETRVLNQAVKRNSELFPEDFMFQLTRDEINRISQIVISSGNLKYSKNVYVFTEQGVAMLSSVLKSKKARHVNIMIMRTFVKLRTFLAEHEELYRKVQDLEKQYDQQFQVVFEAIKQLIESPKQDNYKIGFLRD